MKKLVVMKFGGTSVGTSEMIKTVGEIVKNAEKENNVIVVVSALSGTTNALINLAKIRESFAESADEKTKQNFLSEFKNLRISHLETAEKLLPENLAVKTKTRVEKLFNELYDCLLKNWAYQKTNLQKLDYILSFGEKLSASIISDYLWSKMGKGATIYADKGLITTDGNFGNANVNFEKTNKNINYLLGKRFENELFIVTGFIGANENGETTTLGRGGSDYTASILGAALNVERIEIWTDADGIMSADPKIVKNAVTIPNVSYEEAIEAAYFGAKIIHPSTMFPAMQRKIPILIKNTFNPQSPGTLISKENSKNGSAVKIITSVNDISLINVKGIKLLGIPGTAAKVFETTKSAKINIVLISQASSEHTICFAVKSNEVKKCAQALNKKFKKDIKNGAVSIEIINEQVVLAVVGDGMRGVSGIAGKLFSGLGKNGINITAIAQGGSERNISFVINARDKIKALNAVHHSCVKDGEKNVFLVGTGNVGGKILEQLGKLSNKKIIVTGTINTRLMTRNENNSPSPKTENADWKIFEEWALNLPIGDEKILVDCSAGEETAVSYLSFARNGFHIIAANKSFNAGTLIEYLEIRKIMAKTGRQFRYSANVGAGLPVIALIKELVENGDKIEKIEGVFSGTLSYVFNNMNSKNIWSEVVADAVRLGLAESDPREDLNGQDVAKKMVILGREAHWPKRIANAKVQNLTPEPLRKIPLYEFMKRIKEYDGYFQKQFAKAESESAKIRYVATVTEKTMSARLVKVKMDHPIANLKDSDNIFIIYTRWHKRPIVIQGEGAGGEITASGVISDILKI